MHGHEEIGSEFMSVFKFLIIWAVPRTDMGFCGYFFFGVFCVLFLPQARS